MIKSIKDVWDNTIQPLARKGGIDIRRYPPADQPDWTELAFRKNLPASAVGHPQKLNDTESFVLFCIRHANESNAQLFQDLFVRWILAEKEGGFFVEFGATNGVDLSNTCSLEKHKSWTGILAEPARCWHQELAENRQCIIDTRCVWSRSSETINFKEAEIPELSTIEQFSQNDHHSASRESGRNYEVSTIALNDLLSNYKASSVMDYLSIDTEGSEFSILETLDFDKHLFNIITVEHNFTLEREKIYALLAERGYRRLFPQLSHWDDWYVHSSILSH